VKRIAGRLRIGTALAVLALAVGCRGDKGSSESGEPLMVMAAASLNRVMPELINRFEEKTGQQVTLVTGATGSLAAQLTNGAPADLFFSADEETVERLENEGLIRRGTVTPYAEGRLVLIWRDGAPPPASLVALSTGPYEVVAIANPEVAPYGVAALQALENSSVGESVEGVTVRANSVNDAYQFVRTGNADAGIVALSAIDPATEAHLMIDPSLYEPIRQAAGIVESSKNPSAARFLKFVTGEEGREILARYGFSAPGSR
jgi:molybdate transport system substrate-binding protein